MFPTWQIYAVFFDKPATSTITNEKPHYIPIYKPKYYHLLRTRAIQAAIYPLLSASTERRRSERRPETMADHSTAGPVKAWPGRILRWEGAALSAATIWAYRRAGGSWWFFACGILVPDLSLVGYLSDPATGATLYNIVHSEILPVILLYAGVGQQQQTPRLVSIALIWLAHINRKVP